jgi:tetratricopeptide (TPR) repeat protein
MRHAARALALCGLVLWGGIACAQEGPPPKQADDEELGAIEEAGAKLMEEKKPAEALVKFKAGLAKAPESHGYLYNAGLAAYLAKDYDFALIAWQKLKKLVPDDWRLCAKLIQTYQAKGMAKERDAERDELFKMWKEGKGEGLKKQSFYIRDQFETAAGRVFVIENFDPQGDEVTRYIFSVRDAEGARIRDDIQFSYHPNMDEMAGKDPLKPGEHFWFLEGYEGDKHVTYRNLRGNPSYEEVRAVVEEILKKLAK